MKQDTDPYRDGHVPGSVAGAITVSVVDLLLAATRHPSLFRSGNLPIDAATSPLASRRCVGCSASASVGAVPWLCTALAQAQQVFESLVDSTQQATGARQRATA
jgi:hypothetical protein